MLHIRSQQQVFKFPNYHLDYFLRDRENFEKMPPDADGNYHCTVCDIPIPEQETEGLMWSETDADGNTFPSTPVRYDGQIYNIRRRSPVCKECEQYYLQCNSCKKWLDQDEILTDDYDTKVCHECGGTCSHCGGIFLKDDMTTINDDELVCGECYKNRDTAEGVWYEFYSKHPDLFSINALESAAAQERLPDHVYVTIFEDLNWSPEYGGSAWADIANTWIKLKQIRKSSGTMVDWDQAVVWVDHAFDLAHNTGSLFTKAPASLKQWLMKALDMKRNMNPLTYIDKCSPDVKRLIQSIKRMPSEYYSERQNNMNRATIELLEDIEFNAAGRVEHILQRYNLNLNDFAGTELDMPLYLASINYSRLAMVLFKNIRHPHPANAVDLMNSLSMQHMQWLPVSYQERIMMSLMHSVSSQPELLGTMIQMGKISPTNEWINELKRRGFRPDEYRQEENPQEANPQESNPQMAYADSWDLIKVAELQQSTFFDFYMLSIIDPDNLDEEMRDYARFMKNYTITEVIDELLPIMERAVIREARHVNNEDALDLG